MRARVAHSKEGFRALRLREWTKALRLRLVVRVPTWPELVDLALTEIRTFGASTMSTTTTAEE